MSHPQLVENYLFLGPVIEARLAEEIAEGIPVEGIELMSQARDALDKRALVMYVMWGGDRFDTGETGRAGGGTSQLLRQRWVVWLRVANASQADKDARSTRAGPVLSAIHKALAGWRPDGMRPLLRTQGPAPDYQPASGLYPLAFEIVMAL